MLVTADWCRMMARYNAWQNSGLIEIVAALPEDELLRDRGAWVGSILATLSHLLWADRTWMGRIRGDAPSFGGIPESVRMAPTAAAWAKARRETDDDLLHWTAQLPDAALDQGLTWTPASGGPARTQPLAIVVSHMFNHQTHHRGLVHAMLTAAGVRPPPTDLIAMPQQGTI